MEKVVIMLTGICCIYLTCCLTGCGGSSGWRVSFGVSPVTAINDQQSLEQMQEKK